MSGAAVDDDGVAIVIETERLWLVAGARQLLEMALRDKRGLGAVLGVSVPDGWPELPEAYLYACERLKADPSSLPWWSFLFIWPEGEALIGSGGFKGRPDEDGAVELGYEVAPRFRNRGFATEATRAMMRYAFADRGVARVDAHTLPSPSASTRVLEKVGMRRVAVVHDTADGETWLWSITRRQYHLL